jgi:formyltetrahydrofolate-dependent phosphoribosylglycinamide formyltransferase
MPALDSRTTVRIAVFASGGGSNLDAILRHFDALGARRSGDVALVVADRSNAGALARAHARSIAAVHLTDPLDGAAMDDTLREHDIGLIALAGYLRLVPAVVTRRFRGRMLNVHPALLPAFGGPGMYGMRAHRAVLAAGATMSGASVHFVDEVYDRGPLIAQWPVPVAPDDTPESLAARVLVVEHALYPRVVNAVATGRISLGSDNTVQRPMATVGDAAFVLAATRDATSLEASMDRVLGIEHPGRPEA